MFNTLLLTGFVDPYASPPQGERKKSQIKSDGGSLTSEFVDFTQILDGSILSKLSSKHWRVVRFPVTTVAYNGRSFFIASHTVLANSATGTVDIP